MITFGSKKIESLSLNSKKIKKIWFGNKKAYNSGFYITTFLSNCTGSDDNPTEIEEGGTAMLLFTADYSYDLPSSIVVSNANYTWSKNEGELMLSNASDIVEITIVGNFWNTNPKTSSQAEAEGYTFKKED